MLREARLSGADVRSHGHPAQIEVRWTSNAPDHPREQLMRKFARHGLIAALPYSDTWWVWDGRIGFIEEELPFVEGREALESFHELCPMELEQLIAVEHALSYGIPVSMSVRRVGRAEYGGAEYLMHLFALLDVRSHVVLGKTRVHQLDTPIVEQFLRIGFRPVHGSWNVRLACQVPTE